MWQSLDLPTLQQVLDLLPVPDLASCARVCRHWNAAVAGDDLAWRRRLRRDFRVGKDVPLPPKRATSWASEYKRLSWETPIVLQQELVDHHHEVTGVAFSPGGTYLATVGNDFQALVYTEVGGRFELDREKDLSYLGWASVDGCSFNPDGDLLLVSGSLPADLLGRVLGEMAVLSLGDGDEDLDTVAKISTKPNDAVGCWLADRFVLSSDFKWLAHRARACLQLPK